MEDTSENSGTENGGGGVNSFTVVLFLTSMITSFLYISFNQTKYTYTGEYTFVFKKISIIFSTISLGYFNTLFFPFIKKIPYGDTIYDGISSIMDSKVVQKILQQISTFWFIIAIALLPYGHSVINIETNQLDIKRTEQLNNFYSVFYSLPYYIIFIIFSIIMLCFVITLGEITKQPDDENLGQILQTSYKGLKSTVGFYFKSVKEE